MANSPSLNDTPGAGPLRGIRVIDLCQHIAGPLGAMMLGDLGADVIKVEPPGGEASRYRDGGGTVFSSGFFASNRNKRSLTLDLKHPAAREVFLRLIQRSDALLINLRPSAREKLRVSYEELSTVNPRLIYCSVSGLGDHGIGRDKPGFDTAIQARAGILSVAMSDFDAPMSMGVYVPDSITGVYAALAILAALRARDRTGKGQLIETSLLRSSVFFLTVNLARWLDDERKRRPHRPSGLRSAGFVFRAGDGKPFAIHVVPSPPKHWLDLTQAIGHLELREDPRFQEKPAREQNYEQLHMELSRIFKGQTRDCWFRIFEQYDVAYAPINDLGEALADPYVQELDMIREVLLPDGENFKIVDAPYEFSDTPTHPERAPFPGEHNEAILSELAYSEREIADLVQKGVVPVFNPANWPAATR